MRYINYSMLYHILFTSLEVHVLSSCKVLLNKQIVLKGLRQYNRPILIY